VWALDNDPLALKVAGENLRANGAARKVRLSGEGLEQIRRSFSVVTANLTAETIIDVTGALAKKVAPGGFLILSGILQQKSTGVARGFAERGFKLLRRKRVKQWVTLLFERG
jgi:ribosomal protein L11 methyltransferase